jgi:hypothetical protein
MAASLNKLCVRSWYKDAQGLQSLECKHVVFWPARLAYHIWYLGLPGWHTTSGILACQADIPHVLSWTARLAYHITCSQHMQRRSADQPPVYCWRRSAVCLTETTHEF